MILDKRSSAILWYILHATSYVPMEEITEKLNISKRTIYYDINKINAWLKHQKLPAVGNIQSAGLYLEEETKRAVPKLLQHLNPWQYEYSTKERKAWLAIHIMARSRNVLLQDLIDAIRVSRNTTINDLKLLREEVNRRFGLSITFTKQTGYIMAGSEMDLRKALNVYMSQVIMGKGWQYFVDQMVLVEGTDGGKTALFSTDNLTQIQQTIVNCEERLGVQFTDEVLHQLNLQMILFVRRLLLGGRVSVDPAEQRMLRQTREHGAAAEICHRLAELFQLDIPHEEVDYITTQILSAKVNYRTVDPTEEEAPYWRVIIQRMVDDFQRYACIEFYDGGGLENNLLTHLKPAYYRIKYGLCLENSLMESIRKKYRDIFTLTKKIMHYLEDSTGQVINDDEVAFVAMHFGAWMKREGIKPVARKKVLLVCANGVGTSRILQSQLEDLFSTVDILRTVGMREYIKYESEADFVISTIPLSGGNKPVFVVSPILSHVETESLLKKVNALFRLSQGQTTSVSAIMEIIGRHAEIREQETLIHELKEYLYKPNSVSQEDNRPMLSDLITKDMIQLLEEAVDWEDAIRLASKPLLDRAYIQEYYIKVMIDNIKEFGPYVVMGPKVAIPHARPEHGVNQVGMSLLLLKKGVAFSADGEGRVQIIIVLAAVDNETHLQALAQLSTLLLEEENIESMVNFGSKAEFLNIITQYSN
jgi:mannitol operon transcriptional antiterminator